VADLVSGTPAGLGIRAGVTYIRPCPSVPRVPSCSSGVSSNPARLIGYFEGACADDAIKRAIVEREISDPLTQSRLAAKKVREIAT
jgi:hypothetical protein